MSLDVDSPASPAVPPEAPAKVARAKGKAAKPVKAPKVVKTRAPRTTPVRTFRVRVAELGPHHLEAFDLVVKKYPDFESSIRFALTASDTVDFETRRLVAAQNAVGEAETRLANAKRADADGRAALDFLDTRAAFVAQIHAPALV